MDAALSPPAGSEAGDEHRASRDARDEAACLARLAGPVVIAQVGQMTMGLVDTVMVGHWSGTAMAGVALGHVYSFAMLCFGMGVLVAVDPLLAQSLGARDRTGVARALQQGFVLALLLSVPITLLTALARPALALLHQPPEIVPIAGSFALILAGSAPSFLLFILLRQALQALHHTRPLVVAIIIANVVNAVADYGLIYGKWGLPVLGPVGAAWATFMSRWVTVAVTVAMAWPVLRPLLVPWHRNATSSRQLLRIVRMGMPIGAQFLLEMGAFSAVALFMGWIGTRQVAAHQVAIQLASFTFMVPLGISAAACVRVGHAIGRGDGPGARRAAFVSLLVGGGVMSLSCLAFLAVPQLLARGFTADAGVVATAIPLVRIAGLFQVFDGLQVVSIGILRGAGDTRTPMVVNIVGFLCLGLPASLLLGFAAHQGAPGLWWGLLIGLLVVATTLVLRARARLRRPVASLRV